MKSIPIIQYLLLILVAVACSKDDITPPPVETTIPPKETPPTETVENKAPAAFDLIDIVDGSDNIDLKPIFSWQSAVDPEGEAVTYDLYLDADQEPTTLIAENLVTPNFTSGH